MVPTSFKESNIVFDKPEEMTHDECNALSAYVGHDNQGNPVTVTCWKLTKEEVQHLIDTGRIWSVVSGHALMPQHLQANTPF